MIFALLLLPLSQAFADQCRASIRSKTCLVGHYIKPQKNQDFLTSHIRKMQRPCERESYKYANRLLEVYDRLPAHTKKSFCYIKKIIIYREGLPYGALTSVSYDYKKSTPMVGYPNTLGHKSDGFILEISKKRRFDITETRKEYANKVNHHPFGLNLFEGDHPHPEMPYFVYPTQKEMSPLRSTIIHEVGHFLHLANDDVTEIDYNENGKPYLTSPWAKLSWSIGLTPKFKMIWTPKVEKLFLKRIEEETYDLQYSDFIFKSIIKSNFVSLYSFKNPLEDFAELYHHEVLRDNYQLFDSRGNLVHDTKRRPRAYYQKVRLMRLYMQKGFRGIIGSKTIWRPR